MDRRDTEPTNQLSPAHTQVPEETETDTNVMLEIAVTPEQLHRAKNRFEFDSLNGSITNGAGNLCGALCEVVAIDYLKSLGKEVQDMSTYDYDFISNGKTIDVKAKRQNVKPLPDYRVAVSAWNTKQQCDYYLFATTLYDYSIVYLNGYMSKEEFFDIARLLKKGDNDINGFIAKYDCYILENKHLHNI